MTFKIKAKNLPRYRSEEHAEKSRMSSEVKAKEENIY